MKIKKILIGLSAAGLVIGGLSLSACSAGGSSPGEETGPRLAAVQQTPPAGFAMPTGTAASSSTIYTSSASGVLTALELPQGVGKSAVQINAPLGVTVNNLLSVFLQQFASTPIVVVVSSLLTPGFLVNTSSGALASSTPDAAAASNGTVMWTAYTFNNVTGTSIPKALLGNGVGAYAGINTSGGGFLALQTTPNNNAAPVSFVATPAGCSTNSSSTEAVSIANTTISGGTSAGNWVGIGTNNGEVLIYGVTGSSAGQCQNLTSRAKAMALYSLGSAVNVLSFTTTTSNNYGYFSTQNNQIWRIVADVNNNPTAFTQINGSGFSGSVPPLNNATVTAMLSDTQNNVYVGDSKGGIYLLDPTNPTTWKSFQLGGATPDTANVTSITATSDGSVIAVTANGTYNLFIF